MGLYILGFAAAVVTAWLLKSSVLKSKPTPFILEMPPIAGPPCKDWACGWSIARRCSCAAPGR